MTEQKLTMSVDEKGIATLTLQRPDKHNAFDGQLVAELFAAVSAVQADAKVRVMIIAASGKNFCAGADIAWMQKVASSTDEENLADARCLARLLRALYTFEKPAIALIHGATLGGGIGLAACCDIVLAAPDTYFAFSEVKLGVIPATIAPYVIDAIGVRAARRYFLTGERFEVTQAQDWGLVQQIIPREKLHQTGYRLAELLTNNAPKAIQAAKRLIQQCRPVNKKITEQTSRLLAKIRASAEAQEGLKAFKEKRTPDWEGSQ